MCVLSKMFCIFAYCFPLGKQTIYFYFSNSTQLFSDQGLQDFIVERYYYVGYVFSRYLHTL